VARIGLFPLTAGGHEWLLSAKYCKGLSEDQIETEVEAGRLVEVKDDEQG